MKTKILACLIILLFSFCKNTTKDKKDVEKDLNYHLTTNLIELKNSVSLEKKLTDDVYLRGFAFYKKGENNYNLILELQEDITGTVVSKYTFAVEGFASEDNLNNLSDYAKAKKRKHEAWFSRSDLKKVNNNCYVVLDVKTKVKKFKLLKFYLFDKQGYKGDIGGRVVFKNYKI